MSKDLYRDKLIAYLDGELDGFERSELKNHLETCHGCARELETLKSTLLLTRIDVPPPFAGLQWKAPVVRTLHWWRWVWVPAAAAAVLLLVIFGGDVILKRPSTEGKDWVVVEGDSLSADEGLQLAMTLIKKDQDLQASLVKYDEDIPRDIYLEIEELSDAEKAALLSVLESKTEKLERS